MSDETYRNYFLDPTGGNLENLLDTTLKAVKALGIWWKGADAKVSASDLGQKKKELEEFIKTHQFNDNYSQVKELLFRIMENVRFNRKNFINIHPPPFLPAVLASFLVSIQNPNNITENVSPATTIMEKECIEFYTRLIGYPSEAWGTLVCDGTLGNLTAILVARDDKYQRMAGNQKMVIGIEGLYSRQPGVILTTANVHYSIEKGMWILGIGTRNLIKIPVAIDERHFQEAGLLENDRFEIFKNLHPEYEIEIEKFYNHEQEPFSLLPRKEDFVKCLETLSKENIPIIAILLTAGTTQTGTLENISELIELKTKYEMYFHVDAAIGGYALCVPEIKERLRGIEESDSVTIDGHKLGFVHYPCAAILFKKQIYKELIEHSAPYLHVLSPTIEGSRPGTSAAACWLAHDILTTKGYQAIIEKLLNQTRYLAECLKEENHYQIYHKIDLNTIVFGLNNLDIPRKKINRWNLEVAARLNRKGSFFVNTIQNLSDIKVRNSPSEKNSELVNIQGIRILIMNPFTDDAVINEFISELNQQRKKVIQ
ncbi:MAG: pyridoxal phosphate-dependent decarboxylase family protein [Candidatus Helarchaeota archaeon]